MSTVMLLLSWMLLTAIAAWRPCWSGRWMSWATLGVLILTLWSSSLWWSLARAVQEQEALPLAGPDSAYLSVWVLVLLPIVRRRLDVQALHETLLSALMAAAACALALDSAALIRAGMPVIFPELEVGGWSLGLIVTHLPLMLAGFTLRQLLPSGRAQVHWEYLACHTGLIAMYQAAGGA